MSARLTTRAIEALRPGQELRCDRVPGLYVVCSGRTITYGLQYRHGGKRRRETLGHHPAITLDDARTKAWSMREQLMTGVDPARMAPAASVANVFTRYRAEHLERRRSGAEIARVLDQELVGRFGALRLLDLRRRHIVEMHDEITRRGCPALANRALSYCVTFLSWCGAREIIDANPAAGIKRTIANRERTGTEPSSPLRL